MRRSITFDEQELRDNVARMQNFIDRIRDDRLLAIVRDLKKFNLPEDDMRMINHNLDMICNSLWMIHRNIRELGVVGGPEHEPYHIYDQYKELKRLEDQREASFRDITRMSRDVR